MTSVATIGYRQSAIQYQTKVQSQSSFFDEFVTCPDDLQNFDKLRAFTQKNSRAIIAAADKAGANDDDRLLAALTCVFSAEKVSGDQQNELLSQAADHLGKISIYYRKSDLLDLVDGLYYFTAGDWKRAEPSLTKAIDGNAANSYLANYYLMIIASVHGDYFTARDLAKTLPANVDRFFPQLSLHKARIYLEVELLSGNSLIGRVGVESNDLSDLLKTDYQKLAGSELQKVPANLKRSANYQILMIKKQLVEGKYDAAMQALERIPEPDPAAVQAHYLLGVLFQRITKYKDAYGHFQKAVRLSAGKGRDAEQREYGSMADSQIEKMKKTIEILKPYLTHPEEHLPEIK